MRKIGIIYGMENTFPPALVDRINAMRVDGVHAEHIHIGGIKMAEPSGYRVIVDRISHDIAFYRAYLKNAALNGTTIINNPFWWGADDKFFNYALASRIGVAVPPTVLLPHKSHPPGTTAQSMRNLIYPLNWEEIFDYIGFPAFLKPFSGGGWKSVYKVETPAELFSAYDETGDLCMTLQKAVNFNEYFRCYVVGQQKVHIMQYDPRRPHAHRYVLDAPPIALEMYRRVEDDCLKLCRALGYDLNTVEFAVEDGIPYAIDFLNPAPDAELQSVGKKNFDWIVDAVAEYAVEEALKEPIQRDMRWASFLLMTRPSFTIGIEEEYQTIDPVTRDLRSHIDAEIIAKGKMQLKEAVKAEMHQSVVEVGTGICGNITDAREEVRQLRGAIITLARENGLRLAASGTHPFADWRKQEIYPDERYYTIVEDMKTVARANLIFGLHVHIGVEDRETAIHLMNAARYFVPHMLALSANSPFWVGMDMGLKSYRCKVFDKFPRTNIPDYFPSWGEYQSFVDLLVSTNCIDNAKKIWWDIRPHPTFTTLEFRCCDIPMRLDETIALAALIQATVAKLYKLHEANQGFRLYRRALIMENKWRAARYGLDGKLIDFGRRVEVPMRDLVEEYLAFVDDVVDELGSREAVNGIRKIVENGNGADRQLRVFHETGDLTKVVDYIIEETESSVFAGAGVAN